MNPHTFKILEFDKVLNLLADRTTSELGRKRILDLKPSTNIEYIQTELAKVAELTGILYGTSFPIRGIKNINAALRRAEIEGSFLDPQALLDVASVLETSRLVKSFVHHWKGETPHLKAICHDLTALRGIEDRIHAVISEKAEVKDNASHTLVGIRKDYRIIRDRIQNKLTALFSSEVGKDAIQDQVITLRDDRFVVPVKSNFRGKLRGIVHDESSSGATVFIEPYATVEMNNQLRELLLKEKREVERILREITDLIRANIPEINVNLDILEELDALYGKANFSIEFDCITPQINDDHYLCLENARHPILEAQFREIEDKSVVPLDIHLSKKLTAILITGPNTGGKTVALKTIGLMALMTQIGCPIPAAEHTELPVFEKILADIGDEQSIEQNLSTFSSHLKYIIEILDEADEKSLVLIDETGAGTDPDQGAALGMAILEELVYRGALTVATTHYGSLKAFAHEMKGIDNACMAFDSESLQPTYHLLMGVPGSSKALEIASRLGMPPRLVRKAATHLGAEEIQISSLISDLQENARVMREKRHDLEAKEARLERLIDEYTAKDKDLNKEIKQIKREARLEADRILRDANSLIERTIRDLRTTKADKTTRDQVKKEIQAAQKENIESIKTLNQQDETKTKKPNKTESSPYQFSQGQKIKIYSLQKQAVVHRIFEETNEIEVAMGNLRLRLPLSDIMPLEEKPKPQEKHLEEAGTISSFDKDLNLELDLRGLTFDEAELKIEKYLDDAQMTGLGTVRLIHGKGTGALRRKVRQFLDHHSLVKKHQLAESYDGGSGVTIVELI